MCCFVVESSRLWTPERCDVLLFRELVLNEGVEEVVVEGLVPRLAGKCCDEVRATLAHDWLKADHGGALGCHRHVLGGCREPNDVCPVVGEHRLVPCDAQLQLRVGESQSNTSTIRARLSSFGMVARYSSSVLIAMA